MNIQKMLDVVEVRSGEEVKLTLFSDGGGRVELVGDDEILYTWEGGDSLEDAFLDWLLDTLA